MEGRIHYLTAVGGKKGVGKTHETIKEIRDYVYRSPKRKALLFDVNNEFSDKEKFPDIRRILLKDVRQYAASNLIQIRRVAPFYDDNAKMSLDNMAEVLMWLANNFYNGMLLAEDINKYISDNMPNDVIGLLCTNRHQNLDIILHYQSLSRLTPKIWQNVNWIRMHSQSEPLDRHKQKFPDKFECLKIAELIVKNQIKDGDNRYFLWVNTDDLKIVSGLPDDKVKIAIREYVSIYYNEVVSAYRTIRDENGRPVHNDQQAFIMAQTDLFDSYIKE